MTIKLDIGFVKADDRNLPKIDFMIVVDFIKNSSDFNSIGVRDVKLTR